MTEVVLDASVALAYDASYLELGRRKRAKLATLDERLSSAARQADIGLVF